MKSIWTLSLDVGELNQRCAETLSDRLGIRFTRVGPDFLEAVMPVDARTLQPAGILHGGAAAALAETVGSAAAHYCLESSAEIFVGLELNINHLRPVSQGEIRAVASPLHLGKKTQVWEIKNYNSDQQLVSVARLTLMKVPRSPASKAATQ